MEAVNDDAALEAALFEIRDQLSQDGPIDAKSITTRLVATSQPSRIMNKLSSFLFIHPSSVAEKLPAAQALQILVILVESDTPTFLKAASRAVKEEALRLSQSATSHMHVSAELTAVMIQQLSVGSDVEVSQNSMGALTACCKKLGPAFSATVLQGVVGAMNQAANTLASNRIQASTICVRCAATIVAISVLEDAAMQVATDCQAFDTMMDLLVDESDPLLQMSLLDLLESMAVTQPMHPSRARWLFSTKILQPILVMTGGWTPDSAPDPMLGGSALRVVVALCKLGSTDTAIYDLSEIDLVQALYRALRNFKASGEVDRLAFVDAVSSFASSSPVAMNLVLDDVQTRDAWLSLSVAQPKLKASILVSVARVLDPIPEIDSVGDTVHAPGLSNEQRMKLFATLGKVNGPETTEMLMSLVRSPLPEIRLGAYSLLEAIAKLPTGGQALFTHGRFFEFLMDREVEGTKEGREAKYAVVQTVFRSEVKGLLADDIVRRLEKYLAQGPHHVEVIRWEVAEQ
jgi:Proteasome non-ATPase 26S subunit